MIKAQKLWELKMDSSISTTQHPLGQGVGEEETNEGEINKREVPQGAALPTYKPPAPTLSARKPTQELICVSWFPSPVFNVSPVD